MHLLDAPPNSGARESDVVVTSPSAALHRRAEVLIAEMDAIGVGRWRRDGNCNRRREFRRGAFVRIEVQQPWLRCDVDGGVALPRDCGAAKFDYRGSECRRDFARCVR